MVCTMRPLGRYLYPLCPPTMLDGELKSDPLDRIWSQYDDPISALFGKSATSAATCCCTYYGH